MRKAFTFLASLLVCLNVSAQIPQGISHQAVVRNTQGELVTNSNIGIRVSIIQGTVDGTVVYAETHTILSNANGLVTYVIGNGVVLEGVFEEIDWSQVPYFLKTEVDPTGGTNYSIEGTTQFHSVPFAFHSKIADTATVAQTLAGSVSSNIQAPSVTILPASNIERFTATLNGVVNGEGFLTNVVFEWGISPSLYIGMATAAQSPLAGSLDVYVSASVSGLQSATTYHYRIKASNAVDVVYSANGTFTTPTMVPYLTINEITAINANSSVSGGNITDDGGSPVTARGVVWSTALSPNVENNDGLTYDGTGMGSFISHITGLNPETVYYVRAYATNSHGTGYSESIIMETPMDYCAGITLVEHNGLIYGTESRGGLCWLNRNLGASRVCQSSTDNDCYGDFYQWGRLADGHEIINSGTTETLSSTDVPGHGDFIIANSSPHDWRTPKNDELWQGVSGTNNPCPSGWRVPTINELAGEVFSWSPGNSDGAFESTLRWPLTGARYSDGLLYYEGDYGYAWSSSVYPYSIGGSQNPTYHRDGATMASHNRATGYPVRCVRDVD